MGVPPDAAEIAAAVAALRAGRLVAFPTETVYGLGADAENPAAVRRLFTVKRRPGDHPVIVHLATRAQLADWAGELSPAAEALTRAFWPGPLTVIVRRAARVPDEVTGGRSTVGVRVPDQPVARALLEAFGGGIAAPSANRHGRVSPTTAADVRADLGDDVDIVLDGGPCAVGVESTIVDCTRTPVAIARLGGVSQREIERVLGYEVAVLDTGMIAAPGTSESHYAPRARVRLVSPGDVEARARGLLGEGRRVGVLASASGLRLPDGVVALPPPVDDDDYARVLYGRLRAADTLGLDDLLVVPPPDRGIGAAVNDRLRRAAAGTSSVSGEGRGKGRGKGGGAWS